MSKSLFTFISGVVCTAACGFVVPCWSQSSAIDMRPLPAPNGVLPRLMGEALERHPSIRSQQALSSAARFDLDTARWQYFPTPSLSVEKVNAPNDPSVPNHDERVSTLRIQQPIWTAGKLTAGVKRATELVQTKESGVVEARQQLTLRVLQSYTDFQSAHLRTLAHQASLDGQQRLLDQVERRLNAGAATEADVLLTRSRIESTRADLLGVMTLKSAALTRMSELLQRPINEAELIKQPSTSLSIASDEPEWLSRAMRTSPSLRRLSAQAEVARAELASSKADMYPQLNLRFERQNGSFVYNNYGTVDRVYLSVQSQLSAGLSSFTQQQSADQRVTAAFTDIETEQQNLREQVRNDLTQITNLQIRIPALSSSLQTTRLILEAWERQFLAGRKSWLDVMNAVREILQAENQLIDAQTNLLLLSWRLTLVSDGVAAVATAAGNSP